MAEPYTGRFCWIEKDISNVEVPKSWYNSDRTLNVKAMNAYIKEELRKGVEDTNNWQRRMIALGVPEGDTMKIIEMFE